MKDNRTAISSKGFIGILFVTWIIGIALQALWQLGMTYKTPPITMISNSIVLVYLGVIVGKQFVVKE
jgi:hypothetical protein